MRPALNIYGGRTYYEPRAYTDLMRQSGTFAGNYGPTGKPMPPMRPDGYPAYADSTVAVPGAVLATLSPLPAGRYKIRGAGRGKVDIQFGASGAPWWQTVVLDGSGLDSEIDLRPMTAAQQGTILIRESDKADPVRALELLTPGGGEMFRPEFLAEVGGFAVHRHLDTRAVNADPAVDWTDQPTGGLNSLWRGVPFEDLCRLANESAADAWFCIPYHASDAYVERMAQVIDAHLDPGRAVYIEYSNELWNWAFEQAQAVEAWRLANEPATRRQVVIGRQSARAMNRFRSALSPGRKCVRVVCGQAAWVEDSGVAATTAADLGAVDAIACAPYFADVAPAGATDLDALFAVVEPTIPVALDRTAKWAALAQEIGVPLHLYECGQHLVGRSDAALTALSYAANRDARMGALYTRYLDGLRDVGVDIACLFESHYPPQKSGCWGLREWVGQPEGEAPKAAAVRAWTVANPPPAPKPEPVEPAPASVSIPIELTIAADGTISLRVDPAKLAALAKP